MPVDLHLARTPLGHCIAAIANSAAGRLQRTANAIVHDHLPLLPCRQCASTYCDVMVRHMVVTQSRRPGRLPPAQLDTSGRATTLRSLPIDNCHTDTTAAILDEYEADLDPHVDPLDDPPIL